jgi:hypothetical protein
MQKYEANMEKDHTEPKCFLNYEFICTIIENLILVYYDHGSGRLTLTWQVSCNEICVTANDIIELPFVDIPLA